MTRLSTHTFARRAAANLENGTKLAEAIELPMVADIFATLDGATAARAFILGPYQVAKSAIGQLKLARDMFIRPGPALWYYPTDDASKEFADFKFNPLFDSNPQLRTLLFNEKSRRAKLRYALTGNASLLILSANTESDRHGKTARDLYLDEVHQYENGWIEQIENRTGAYSDEFLHVFMSTGLDALTEAAILWSKTDQRVWHCRCPDCHRLFEPRFAHYNVAADGTKTVIGGLRYDRKFLENGLPDEPAIAASIRYECPHCHSLFANSPGTRQLFSGTAQKPAGMYVSMNANPAPKHYGWQFHGIAVRDWLRVAVKFEYAQLARQRGDIEPLAKWIREECAGIWNSAREQTATTMRPLGDYVLGEKWPGVALDPAGRPVHACTVDVQLDHFVLGIRAWSKTETRLLWCEKVTTPSRVRDRCMEFNVIPERVFLDGRHEPQYVRRVAAQFGWRVLLGESDKDYFHKASGLRRIFSEPRPIDAYAGTGLQGQGIVLEINFSKQSALSRLHLLRTIPTADGRPFWTAAKDAPDWYWKEVEAHYKVRKKNPDGSEYDLWMGLKEDHAGDFEAMQVIFASMAGLIGAESLETVAQSPAPKP